MTRHTWQLAPPVPTPPAPVLDPVQRRAVAWASGPALVVGGPGTGKSTVIMESALARLAEGAAADSVLVLARGRDAAARLREHLTTRAPGRAAVRVTTFHAFALALVTRLASPDEPWRLLSGAEQEHAVRDVIEGTLREPALQGAWPSELLEAVSTRGFAKEARAAFAAARSLGLAGDEITAFGRNADDLAWTAIGPVLDAYLESQEQQRALDYAELMFRALRILHDPANASLLAGLRFVYVDEYEESDAMQAALLGALSNHVESVVAAADPDQSVFAFRGAQVENIRRFRTDFQPMAVALGQGEVQVFSLDLGHRFAASLLDFASATFGAAVPTVLPVAAAEVHRRFRSQPRHTEVRVQLYDDASSEAAHTVAAIRALRSETGDGWEEFAVMTRSAGALRTVERALQRAGIPCLVDVRSGRLTEQPAVRVLLRALDAVSAPELRLEPAHAHELVVSAMCGLDASEVRSLSRLLRSDRRTPSDMALALALSAAQPALELADEVPGALAFESLRALLQRVHARVRAGATPHEALWLLWSGSSWPQRLRRQAVEQGSALAHRDLDAVCELFDIADRAVLRRQGRAGVASFVRDLLEQEVPAETLAPRGFNEPAVQLLTAHAAKGLQWKHVFMVGVDEGVWPNLRRRSTLLDVDRLTTGGLVQGRSRQALFDEERRLFYMACTRAGVTLVVSGTRGDRAKDAQPSRFLEQTVVPPVAVVGRPVTLDSAGDLVATLRRVATSERVSPALRAQAVRRLRELAALTDEAGEALFPEADAARWWGTRMITDNPVPVSPLGHPLYVRGSSLDSLGNCSLNWFLEQRVHAESSRGSAVVFGSALHALADGLAKGELAPDPDLLAEHLRSVWNEAGYDSRWQSDRDFEEGLRAISRLLHWHTQRTPTLLASEVAFDRVIEVKTPSGRVEQLRMRGSIDRIEISDDLGLMVFDYKTGRRKFAVRDVEESGQLRYYQLAAARGLLELPAYEGAGALRPAGAAFVNLRVDAASRDRLNPSVQVQAALAADDPWITEVLGAGLERVREEQFQATSGRHCSYCQMKGVCPVQPEGRVEPA